MVYENIYFETFNYLVTYSIVTFFFFAKILFYKPTFYFFNFEQIVVFVIGIKL